VRLNFLWCKYCEVVHKKTDKSSVQDCCSLDEVKVCRGYYLLLKEKGLVNSKKRCFQQIFIVFLKFLKTLGKFFLWFFRLFSIIIRLFVHLKSGIMIFFEKIRKKSISADENSLKSRMIVFFLGEQSETSGQIFKYNRYVNNLNDTFSTKRLGLLYFFIFLRNYALVFTLSLQYLNFSSSDWLMHYIYACFLLLNFILEAFFTSYIISQVNRKTTNKTLKEFSLWHYFLPLLQTQVIRYDYYTDLLFIVANVNAQRYIIVAIASAFLGLITVINWVNIITLFSTIFFTDFLPRLVSPIIKYFQEKNKKVSPLQNFIVTEQEPVENIKDTFANFKKVQNKTVQESNYYINFYGKLSLMLDLKCVGHCLDRLSTKNAWYFPYLGGFYVPQIISSAVIKLCLENIPGIILQLYVLVVYEHQNQGFFYYPIVISTCVSLVSSFWTALQARSCMVEEGDLRDLESKKNEQIDD